MAYALDGAYQTFQQGATVAENQSTPVQIAMKPTQMVNVIFTVSVPDSTQRGVPLRLAGNFLQLGNTFSDLQGGLSTVADRMPVLSPLPDGRYSVSLFLPIGAACGIQVHTWRWFLEFRVHLHRPVCDPQPDRPRHEHDRGGYRPVLAGRTECDRSCSK